jgi:WD40 repeat protein
MVRREMIEFQCLHSSRRNQAMIFRVNSPLSATLFLFLAAITGFAQKPELVVQTGHSSLVTAVAFSPDGKTLATGSLDETIKLWDTATGSEFRTFRAGLVIAVAFSVDGKTLASGGGDKSVTLWEVSTGAKLRTFAGHSSHVFSVAFSPDGKTLASCGADGTVKRWDISTGAELQTLAGHTTSVSSVAFSLDGKILAGGNDNHTIQLWDTSTGAQALTLKGHTGKVSSIAFSPDGKTLASGSDDRTVKLWNVSTGGELLTLKGHTDKVRSVAFSPAGKYLASGSDDRTVKLWNVSTASELRTFDAFSVLFSSVVFSPDGKALASNSDNMVKLWEVSTGSELQIFKRPYFKVGSIFADPLSVAFSPDGKTVAGNRGGQTINLWDVSTPSGLRTLKGQASDSFSSLAFSPDGKTLASGSGPRAVKLWDVATGAELRTIKWNISKSVFLFLSDISVAFSPSGKILAGGSGDKTVKLWEVSTGKTLRTLKGHSSSVNSVVFSSDGKTLASGSLDHTVRLWDVLSGAKLGILKGHTDTILSVDFSPDGKTIATGSLDKSVKLWDVSATSELRTLKGNSANTFSSVAFSPDGKTLATGNWDHTIQLWDIASGRELKTLEAHTSSVHSVAFSPDGKTLVSGGRDLRIHLWDVGTGSNLGSLIGLDEKDWVVVTPDGRFDGSAEGMKRISYVQDNKLIPLDAFFEQFFTSKLLQKVYAREAPTSTTVRVDFSKRIKLPPLVHIASPKPGATSESARIVVEATDQGGGVEDIRLYQNGKLVSEDTRQLARENRARTRTFDVTFVPGINTFRATAFNTDRTEATSDELKIELKAVEASSDLYILAVGLNEYKNTSYSLNYGRADAQAFADAIEKRGRGIFKQIYKQVILDGQATREGIEAGFNKIVAQAKPQDAFVFYFAGHGVMSEGSKTIPAEFFLVPYDVIRLYGDDGALATSAVAARLLRDLCMKVRAQKQLIVLDACQSAGALESFAMRGAAAEKAISQLARSAGVVVLAATGQEQVASEFVKLGHGVFTYALLQALNGDADGGNPPDGKITANEIVAYINDRVPELTRQYRGKTQYPSAWARGQDFPIAIK